MDIVLNVLGFLLSVGICILLFTVLDFLLFYAVMKSVKATEEEAKVFAKGWHFKWGKK